jgi:hypothetical protein
MLALLQRRTMSHIYIYPHHALVSFSFCRQTFTLRVFVANRFPVCPSNMTRFLGAWFGAFPFALSEVNGRLRAKHKPQVPGPACIGIPPFTKSPRECQTDLTSIAPTREKLIGTLDALTKDREASLSLEAGKGLSVLGGVCSNETDFTGSLKRYFREILADVVHEKSIPRSVERPDLWLEESLGVTSRHRKMRTYYQETEGVVDERVNHLRNGIEYDSYLSHRDYALAQRSLVGNAGQVFTSTQNLGALMDHMENLGHTSAPYVEGLTVELLPFQSQTVGWATEREQTPGGIQAFLSTKLPTNNFPNQELYYNFVTGKISPDKPHLVRGGIIAEQMGLGKTVSKLCRAVHLICSNDALTLSSTVPPVSLALILRNPAPALPESGSPASSIKVLPNALPEKALWDPDIYTRTSATKKKRGNIISRGTLVVVSP